MDELFPKIDINLHIRDKKSVTAWVGLPEFEKKDMKLIIVKQHYQMYSEQMKK